jgi:acetolactate synthase I/II/III large subunit
MTREEWVAKCQHWKAKWPVMQPEYLSDTHGLNIYAVLEAIHQHSPDDAVIMADAGSAFYMVPQAYKFKGTQRMVHSQSQGDMGWALPAAIGVAKAGAKNVIAIMGDGSFMSNMQELAVILRHNLPIKIVVLNNGGYLSIKNTQSRFYGNVHGVNFDTGLWFPEFKKVAETFGISWAKMDNISQIENFGYLLGREKSCIIECLCAHDQQILPSQAFKDGKQAPLHDMMPFLSDEELAAEMVQS